MLQNPYMHHPEGNFRKELGYKCAKIICQHNRICGLKSRWGIGMICFPPGSIFWSLKQNSILHIWVTNIYTMLTRGTMLTYCPWSNCNLSQIQSLHLAAAVSCTPMIGYLNGTHLTLGKREAIGLKQLSHRHTVINKAGFRISNPWITSLTLSPIVHHKCPIL